MRLDCGMNMSNMKANFNITTYYCIIAIPYNSESFQRKEVVPIFRFNVQFLNLLPYQFEVNLLTSFIPLLSFRCLNFSISQFLNFLISQFPNVSISQFSNFSISWLKHFRYFHPLPSPIEIIPSSKMPKQKRRLGTGVCYVIIVTLSSCVCLLHILQKELKQEIQFCQ